MSKKKNFQAIVIVPDEDPGVLCFNAETINEAKALLSRYVTNFFPGSWTRDSVGNFLFLSKEFNYSITLKEAQPDE